MILADPKGAAIIIIIKIIITGKFSEAPGEGERLSLLVHLGD